MFIRLFTLGLLSIALFMAGCSAPTTIPEKTPLDQLDQTIRELVTSGKVVGVQALVGEGDMTLLQLNGGYRSATDKTRVDADTMFCIGSCSKPFTSVAVMSVVQDGKLKLDEPIDGLLPGFHEPQIVNVGKASRAPNLRELLAHRSGIYSQKLGMNQRQENYIRDFTLTLDESVTGIAGEKLIAEPGALYAYSGAGYCVIGRLAEESTGQAFEQVMRQRVVTPLGLKRTSYFPDRSDRNVASGSVDGKPNPSTPHLYEPFNLPLIGGSLYSTAEDCARFMRMMINRGQLGGRRVLSRESWHELTRPHFEGQGYGLGWSLLIGGGKTRQMSHNGALASSRASMKLDLKTGRYAVVLYTLSDPSLSEEVGKSIARGVTRVLGPVEH
ncbi:MAG: serine hydrolase domain-containing protein [Planctomycetota bacterium]|jgi:CubicO group peptidase (beta-lactamase class C family)